MRPPVCNAGLGACIPPQHSSPQSPEWFGCEHSACPRYILLTVVLALEADCPEFDSNVLRAVLSDFYITSTHWYVLMIEYQVGFAWHLSKIVMIPCELTNLFRQYPLYSFISCSASSTVCIRLDPPLERPIATTSATPLAMSQPGTMSTVSSLGANIRTTSSEPQFADLG